MSVAFERLENKRCPVPIPKERSGGVYRCWVGPKFIGGNTSVGEISINTSTFLLWVFRSITRPVPPAIILAAPLNLLNVSITSRKLVDCR